MKLAEKFTTSLPGPGNNFETELVMIPLNNTGGTTGPACLIFVHIHFEYTVGYYR